MEPILVALAALFVSLGLIVGGTRFSLYLFLLKADSAHRFVQRMPVTEEQMSQTSEYGVDRHTYYGNVYSNSSSARYARNLMLVIALILLFGIMVAISIVAGLFH